MTDATPSMMATYGARLIENGYRILPIRPGFKSPGRYSLGAWTEEADWQRHCDRDTSPIEHEMWQRWPGCAVGVAGGNVCGIDIDILDDGDLALDIEALARKLLGDTPALRIGQAPKRMLIYRTAEPFKGRKRAPLEVLAHGNQFLVYAIHPVTGLPYAWPDDSLADIDIASLPEITERQAVAWLDQAYIRIPAKLRPASATRGDVTAPASDRSASDPRGTREAVASALACIPNADLDGASWVQIGNAIKAALGEDGRDLWVDWSRSSSKSGASGKSDTAERRWKGFRPHSIGAGTLYYLAEQRGWTPAPDLILNADKAARMAEPHPAAALLLGLRERTGQVVRVPVVPFSAPRFPPSVMDVDGALAEFVEYANHSAIRYQPILALAVGLCMIGAIAGRKYAAPGNLRTNLYAIGIADTGAGKEAARICAKLAMQSAGLSQHMGGGNLASGPSLFTSLQECPSRLFLLGEMGQFMGVVAAKNADAHKREILTNLTTLFGEAGSVHYGTEYADQKARKRIDIIQPNPCVYGETVPTAFWRNVNPSLMADGTLPRYLYFVTDDSYPDHKKLPKDFAPPASLVDIMRRVAAGADDWKSANGNLEGVNVYEVANAPHIVPFAPGVEEYFDECKHEETRLLKEAPEGSPDRAAIARLVEHSIKLALVRAISRNPERPEITRKDGEWAWTLASHSVNTLVRECKRFVSDNPVEATHKRVLEVITKAGGSISRRDLGRRTGFLKPKELAEVIMALKENEEITETVEPGKTKPTSVYSLVEGAENFSL